MKELKRGISAVSADLEQLQSLPADIDHLARTCAAPSHIGPIEFSKTLGELRRQAAAAAAEARAVAALLEQATPLQEFLARYLIVYQQQHAAIAALEAHLRAYGYNAECPWRAPAEPLSPPDDAQHQAADDNTQMADGQQADCRFDVAEGGDGTPEQPLAGHSAAAASAADAVSRSPTAAPVPATEPATSGLGKATAESPAAVHRQKPLAVVTNLQPPPAVRQAGKPEAPPAPASASSGTPFSVSPSLRKLQQKYAARSAAVDSPPEDMLALPPRLATGSPAAAGTQLNKQHATGGIGRWQPLQPHARALMDPKAAEPPTQQRLRPSVRFAGVRSMSRSPAVEPAAEQPALGRRASVYGQAGVSTGGGGAAAALLQDDAGRPASMYAAVDLAAADEAAVGPPGGWATSAELRTAKAQAAAAAEDPGLGPVTPAPPTAPSSTGAEAELAVSSAAAGVTHLDGFCGLARAPMSHPPPPPLQQHLPQQAPAQEESTMELYSQLIRRRRSPEPQVRTPQAQMGQPSFCYTPLTYGAPAAISPDTVSLLSRAFEPTSVSKVTVLGKVQSGSTGAPTASMHGAEAAEGHADMCEGFSMRLPPASVAFAKAGVAAAPQLPASAAVQGQQHIAAPPAQATQPTAAQLGASTSAAPPRGCPPPRKLEVAVGRQHALPKAPEPSPRAAAVMARFAAQQVCQSAAPPAPPLGESGGNHPDSTAIITAEAYGSLPAYIRSQIGLAALDAAVKAAASAAGGFTADTLEGSAGSAKAARAAVNCLMKLGRARCEVKGGQMVYHIAE